MLENILFVCNIFIVDVKCFRLRAVKMQTRRARVLFSWHLTCIVSFMWHKTSHSAGKVSRKLPQHQWTTRSHWYFQLICISPVRVVAIPLILRECCYYISLVFNDYFVHFIRWLWGMFLLSTHWIAFVKVSFYNSSSALYMHNAKTHKIYDDN